MELNHPEIEQTADLLETMLNYSALSNDEKDSIILSIYEKICFFTKDEIFARKFIVNLLTYHAFKYMNNDQGLH